MAIAIASPQRVVEIPQIPSNSVVNLKRFFSLSIFQYAMLAACERDDIIKFGCDPRTVNSWPERIALKQLANMGRIEFSTTTGKWELLSTGKMVLELVPLLIHLPCLKTGLAEVIPFPLTRIGGNGNTVQHR